MAKRTAQQADRTSTHECPAPECHRPVPAYHFACPTDWFRLPKELQQAITSTYRRDAIAHIHAMGDAMDWYRDNPLLPL